MDDGITSNGLPERLEQAMRDERVLEGIGIPADVRPAVRVALWRAAEVAEEATGPKGLRRADAVLRIQIGSMKGIGQQERGLLHAVFSTAWQMRAADIAKEANRAS